MMEVGAFGRGTPPHTMAYPVPASSLSSALKRKGEGLGGPLYPVSTNRRKSKVWQYYTQLSENHVECNVCKKQLSFHNSTTTMRKHLVRKHSIRDSPPQHHPAPPSSPAPAPRTPGQRGGAGDPGGYSAVHRPLGGDRERRGLPDRQRSLRGSGLAAGAVGRSGGDAGTIRPARELRPGGGPGQARPLSASPVPRGPGGLAGAALRGAVAGGVCGGGFLSGSRAGGSGSRPGHRDSLPAGPRQSCSAEPGRGGSRGQQQG
ncbi:hypothetical protein EOD39_14491 [Acipenser ruthenus]|uniref:BED-type domain-containing protein n=1 Tax=Acipenser ruthenus TaxID=7906 RepID=A0A444UFT8_ACIRT|nr:hypothetical protein EOD39_14491 [Acipenser ruthenus]